ncbi:hypothetical protein FHS19_003816 [Paenibacillus rhizosphaerae]|uniref:DUF4364 domain-containing protein n=1 Tax=Paenibacillus rhizosphaerae TaxID=297318 RepID=A0A839TRG7_9BACL|nr:DUF4364 family protein [Paenibacillus rhizosphaerae]MBB3129141.1 hypothetical protein [Paenibacillus rhizosphaerae]
MSSQESYALCALAQMGQLSVGELSRFLFETGLVAETDLKLPLTSLKEQGLVYQTVNLRGIVYEITDAGRTLVNGDATLARINVDVAAKSAEYKRVFEQEKDYIAQYTESSTGVVPVFLSIRDGSRIILKINIIVRDIDTAKKICSGWMGNSARAFDAVWQAIAGDAPDPGFWTSRPEEGKA